MEHFVDLVNKGYVDKLLVSADANCSPLGWPGVKGHTINYIFEDMIPDMRTAGIDDATIKLLLEDNPADFLSLKPDRGQPPQLTLLPGAARAARQEMKP